MVEPTPMAARSNAFGQLIGPDLSDWKAPPLPSRRSIRGDYAALEPIDPAQHAPALFDALGEGDDSTWTYMAYGPFDSLDSFTTWMVDFCLGTDPLFFAIRDLEQERWLGFASFLRIDRKAGSLEVGHIVYAPALRRTRAATEAMALLMRTAFGLGYRRYEWKCDAHNGPSRRAAARLGFKPEGIHRNAVIYKARNRDTAWYSILDAEWPAIDRAQRLWLDRNNFDAQRRQRRPLEAWLADRETRQDSGLDGGSIVAERRSDGDPSGTLDGDDRGPIVELRPGVQLRPARRRDLDAIVSLLADDPLGATREQTGSGPASAYVEAFAAIQADPLQELVVVERASDVVGTLQLSRIPGLSRGGAWRGQIESVRISRALRGHGLGRALIEWAIARARAHGCGLVQLTSDKQRLDAHAFYAELGFTASHEGYKLKLD